MRGPVFIEGKRIYLRPLEMADLERFYGWYNDPKLRRNLLLPYPLTRMDEKQFIGAMTKSKTDIVLSIVVRRGDRLVGNVGLHRIDRVNRSAMLGIAIADPAMVSRGYGTEAMRLALDYGFRTQNLHRIELSVHDFNTRALGTYGKLGFVEEGRKREAIYSDGQYHSSIVMSILKDEWMRSHKRKY